MNFSLVYEGITGKAAVSVIADTLKASCAGITLFDVDEQSFDACTGCFGCWVKTPGKCVQKKTDNTAFLQYSHDADYIIFASKITFGGYSSKVKAYIDRIIPLSPPVF